MRTSSSPTQRRRAPVGSTSTALVALVAGSLLVFAQPAQGQQPVPALRRAQQRDTTQWVAPVPTWLPSHLQPQQPQAAPPQPQALQPQPPRPEASIVIARVESRNITQADFDRIAVPYFQKVRADLGASFDEGVQKIATLNVLDELFRRELLAVEAQRKKVEASQSATDALLIADPLFLTNGQFDSVKFSNYKTNPTSNYLQVAYQRSTSRGAGGVSADPITANTSLRGIGFSQGLAGDLPGLPVGKWVHNTYRAGNLYLVIRVREKIPQRPAEFDEVKNQAIADMKNEKRRAVLNEKVEAIRSALGARASFDSLAAPYGGLVNSGFQTRQTRSFVTNVGSEPRVVEKAFAAKPGEADTVQAVGGVVWIRVEEQRSGDPAALKAASAQIEADLLKVKYDEWLEQRKRTVRIEVLRPDLQGLRPSPVGTVTVGTGG